MVGECGEVSVEEVCVRFGVSPATARRDLGALAERGLVEKTWGGARRIEDDRDMVPASEREEIAAREKGRIARVACELVQDGDVLLVDGGTTTLHMAAHLANRRVRILTNSLLVAHRIDALRQSSRGAEVSLTGGLVYPGSGLLVGPQAVENLAAYHARWAFLSVGGIDGDGASNTNEWVVQSERAMIGAAEKVVLLADSTKFGKRDMVRECRWSEVDLLITDKEPGSWAAPKSLRVTG